MRFVYRIEIIDALKPIVHLFELPYLPLTGLGDRGTPMKLCVSCIVGQGDAHEIMRFVYRIEIIDALKPIVHLFELPYLPLTGLDPIFPLL